MSRAEDLVAASQAIKAEAVQLLFHQGLAAVLAEHGTLVPTGSYALDLMTWRDLDLYLGVASFDKNRLYALVHRLADLLQPFWLEAKSMIDNPEPDFARGFYVGMETRIIGAHTWNIDLLMMSAEDVAAAQAEVERRGRALDPAMRTAILEIKSHPEYPVRFSSMDVYDAVIQGQVRSMPDFERWQAARPRKG